MIFAWWDDARDWARLTARATGTRQKVAQADDGHGWTVTDTHDSLIEISEVCS